MKIILRAVSVIALGFFLIHPQSASSDVIRLKPKSHHEVWSHLTSGAVAKDFIWTVTPIVSDDSAGLTIHLDEGLVKKTDGFCGVTCEMDFSNDALKFIDVDFTNGTSQRVTGGEAHFAGKLSSDVAKITANFEAGQSLGDRHWVLAWAIGAMTPPDRAELHLDLSRTILESAVGMNSRIEAKISNSAAARMLYQFAITSAGLHHEIFEVTSDTNDAVLTISYLTPQNIFVLRESDHVIAHLIPGDYKILAYAKRPNKSDLVSEQLHFSLRPLPIKRLETDKIDLGIDKGPGND